MFPKYFVYFLVTIPLIFTQSSESAKLQNNAIRAQNENTDFCSDCAAGFDDILGMVSSGEEPQAVMDAAVNLCHQLGEWSAFYCDEFLRLAEADIIYILFNTANTSGEDICGTAFVGKGCLSSNPIRNWEVSMPNVSKPPMENPPYNYSSSTLKVLHLADTHYDPLYQPGSNSLCPEIILCCRNDSGEVVNPEDAAGYWGDYRNCDSPKWLLELMYEHIANTHQDIDFIIWTGDLVAHNIWSTTRESNLQVITDTANMIESYFPGIPVYPALGNHEGHPSNFFPPPEISEPAFDISWLYDELVQIWGKWLPPDTASSIANGAYYSALVFPGFRILSLNGNLCNGYNLWLVYDSNDVASQLELFALELQAAEDAGEKVYIINHIPSGFVDCDLSWSREFNKIVSRYENTVSGLFFGHTHKDHFQLFFDPEDPDRVYEVAYIGQSQTPYTYLNPGYKLYTIEGNYEGSNYRVLDHENWIMDLALANAINYTTFYRLYEAKEEYEMIDLSPESWLSLIYEMNMNDSVKFDHFYRNYLKDSSPLLSKGCDQSCKDDVICDLLISDNSDRSKCQMLR